MATCKNCIGYEYCNPQPKNPRKVEKWCDRFKNKADFVEVVRCKDCKFYERFSIYDDDYYCMAEHTQSLYSPNENDFCCYGVRRGAEDGN